MATVSSNVLRDLAPSGTLRVAINLGNSVLAQTDPRTGEPTGVSVALARRLAERLGAPARLITFDAAGKVFAALQKGELDIAFLAIEPARAAEIAFTAPYVLIEGNYVVPADSDVKSNDEMDRKGRRIAVAAGSAYDLFLSRTLKNAELVRHPTGEGSIELFLSNKLDAVAGVKQPLMKLLQERPGLRMIEPRFMAIQQAMGTPRGRDAGAAYLRQFIEEMKASGFVKEALTRSNQHDAIVAPPAAA